jgi:hypothetical protein
MTKKGLSKKPKHDRRIFTDTPQHRDFLKFSVRFPNDINALVFQRIEMGVFRIRLRYTV